MLAYSADTPILQDAEKHVRLLERVKANESE